MVKKTGLYKPQCEDLKQSRLAEFRKEITIGGGEADRGEFVDGRKVFAAIRKRSAARKRARR